VTSCCHSPLTSSAPNGESRKEYNNLPEITGKHSQKKFHTEFLSHFQKQEEDSAIMWATLKKSYMSRMIRNVWIF
jgi:hypothetical protein